MPRAIDPKAKAKRQKIIAVVGGVILVVLVAWRVPPVIALMNKKPPAQGSTPVTAPVPVAPIPGAPVSPDVPPASSSGSGDLADSDPVPVAGPGQLVSFGRFVSKDPFAPQAGKRCADDNGASVACPASTPGSTAAKPKTPIKAPEPDVSEPDSMPTPKSPAPGTGRAQISVNGQTEGVSVNTTFPSADPVFKLVSVSVKSAKIAVDGGSYATGAGAITLRKGEAVTLVNTADGTRYLVVLVSTV
jgi:hypothetical protein